MIFEFIIRHFYSHSFLADLETFLIFRRSGIYFGRLKLDSCVNRVKTGERHFVQESLGSRTGLGPSAELSCPWGHLAINLWPGSTSPPGFLSVFFTWLTHPLSRRLFKNFQATVTTNQGNSLKPWKRTKHPKSATRALHPFCCLAAFLF